jgi:putative redox protein
MAVDNAAPPTGALHDDRRGPRQLAKDEAHRARAPAQLHGRRTRRQRQRRPGVTPHDLYDSALGACKPLTTLWHARRKQYPVEDIRVTVERDHSEERRGVYRLNVRLALTGALTEAQRQELLAVAGKCPVHKLTAQAATEVVFALAPLAA